MDEGTEKIAEASKTMEEAIQISAENQQPKQITPPKGLDYHNMQTIDEFPKIHQYAWNKQK